jgi:hypothetical protein
MGASFFSYQHAKEEARLHALRAEIDALEAQELRAARDLHEHEAGDAREAEIPAEEAEPAK